MAEKQKKARRISGKAYYKLKELIAQRDKLQEDYQVWCEQYLVDKETDTYYYPDQVNFLTGRISDALDMKQIIGRLPYDVLDESRKKIKAIEAINVQISSLMDRIADAANTLPRLINQTTGEIVKALRNQQGQVVEEIEEVETIDIDLDDDDAVVQPKVKQSDKKVAEL